MRVYELIEELQKYNPKIQVSIFIPEILGEDSRQDLCTSDFRVNDPDERGEYIELYSNQDLKSLKEGDK